MISPANTAAVVVWFHPSEEQKTKSDAYRSMVGRVYVVDNTSHNRGIATALNEGFRQAIADGYEWVLTMDQDSVLSAEQLRLLMQEANAYSKACETGLFSVRQVYGDKVRDWDRYEQRLTVMCSGNLVRVKAFQEVGGMRDELFIDSVDDDFCMRLLRRGWLVVMTNRVLMEHSLGNGYRKRPIGRRKYLQHAAFRHYYILRNLLYMQHDYPEHKAFFRHLIRKHISHTLLYDFDDRRAKLRANWQAWRDYRCGITGPRTSPDSPTQV